MPRRRICGSFTAPYPHQNCGDGQGHQDGKHCITNVTCTLTETECKKPCCSGPGAPGWDNNIILDASWTIINTADPQECCQTCFDSPDCLAWRMGIDDVTCFHNNDLRDSHYCKTGPLSHDVSIASGTMRCGSNFPFLPCV
ncbi:17920_t:CDS:2 [Acaulospora morrowiae]|uniref:17920_t:CDS:1 n=1 Tax=Acaulospora morrowiae TaxID=94023 RepID=A0A9N9B5C6_9GLOM|nr:17920_t:CDS:2 [Acaulospora morrowiae]